MEDAELAMIEEAGALAFRAGTSALNNPFHRTRTHPAITGMPGENWLPRAAAWQTGWKREADKNFLQGGK
jgi:hypothetical protein